ncbi:hypothetical protein FQR65_LT07687 [Abscondita terminalis]|nr:hypothetical protein FQR65_LT07687 [Abscondita terminalis]
MDTINALTRHFTVETENYERVEEDDDFGVVAKNREKTDLPFVIVHGLFFFVLVFFISYCVVHGDIDRLLVGYDRCGNVCGKRNNFVFDFETQCRAEDMQDKPFFEVQSSRCVETCDRNDIVIGQKCFPSANGGIPSDLFSSIGRDLHQCSSVLIGSAFVGLGFAFVMFLILRFMTAAFVWTALFGVVGVCGAVTGYLWYITDYSQGFNILAAASSIFTLIILLIILCLRKRIQLVIQLLKEAGKAITAIPILVLQPILTFASLGLYTTGFIYFCLWIESAGAPRLSYNDRIIFHQNGIINFTRWLNIFVMLWMVQFIYGCQNMILAGAVCKWYFTRSKQFLRGALFDSIKNTCVYHLGTISLGSLIIALIQMLRLLIRLIRRVFRYPLYLLCLCCIFSKIENCLQYIEGLVKYYTRNAYIVTALHGTAFVESGSKAFKLLFENVLQVFAINSVGDFVLILGKILIVISTIIIGILLMDFPHLNYSWLILLIIGAVAYLIAHCFFTVYEMAVDTIFICFCEDCNINDGMTRPYYMPASLMEFVEKSKVVLNIQMTEVNSSVPA